MRELVPFDPLSDVVKKVSVIASVKKESEKLVLQFFVEDPEGLIVLSNKSNIFSRSQELWKHTCFECFFSEKNKKDYWELNLDHGGNWNLYYFENYRTPSIPAEEKRVQQLELEFLKKKDGFELQCHMELKELGLEEKHLDVSAACVIEWEHEAKAYFALKHCGNKPDFHLRESFVCNLE